MDYMGNLTSMFLARTETQYNELNDNINRLIEDLGQKMQKELVVIEEKILLKYKENLQEAQQNYRDLQEKRNDETIKENILNLKSEKEKVYHQES
jgi:cation transport regulator ChaB